MARKQEVSKLHAELESFGRRARRLTAARLQAYPSVLATLFGDEALVNTAERQMLAERVERAMLGLIEGISDTTDRRIAEAVFAARPEFYDLNVTQRQDYIETVDGVAIRELYKTRRARVVGDMAATLQRMFGAQGTANHDALLSPEARRAAQRLYRDAQSALVAVEAFDVCLEYGRQVLHYLRTARSAGCHMKHFTYGWLSAYDSDGKGYKLAPMSRSFESDEALWTLAYCHKHLRVLMRDLTGRDYLRENLSQGCYMRIQQGAPFQVDEVDKMLAVHAGTQIDTPEVFVNDLRKDSQGRAIHDLWLEALTTEVFEFRNMCEEHPCRMTMGDRGRLASDLLQLCMTLQHVSPETTIRSLHDASEQAIARLIWTGLLESGIPVDDLDDEQVDRLIDDLLRRRPLRYSSETDESVWNDELPEHDPWPEFR